MKVNIWTIKYKNLLPFKYHITWLAVKPIYKVQNKKNKQQQNKNKTQWKIYTVYFVRKKMDYLFFIYLPIVKIIDGWI